MKNLLIMMLLVFSTSIVLSQKSQTYLVDDQGSVTKKTEKQTKEITLIFEDDVPELTDVQVSELIKNGEVHLNRENLKGSYEQFILFYVPKFKFDVYVLNNGKVSFENTLIITEPRQFSWWFLFAVLGIISMIFFQKHPNVFAAVFSVVFAFACIVVVAFAGMFEVVFAFACMFAFAGIVVVVGMVEKKLKNILAYIYYALMILASVLAYLQI